MKFLLPIFLIVNTLYAQSGFVSFGGDLSNSSGSISYSIGQIQNLFFSNSAFKANEGLQQPNLGKITTSVDKNNDLIIEINYSSDANVFNLSIPDIYRNNTEIVVLNLNGQIILSKKVSQVNQELNLNNLFPGLYLINFISLNNSNIFKSQKILVK